VEGNETVRWRVETSAGLSQHETYSRLVVDKAEVNNGGLYECEAVAGAEPSAGGLLQHSSLDHQGGAGGGGDKLRRFFGLLVNGK